MKPKDCVAEVIAEVEIETKLSASTPEDTKDPGSALETESAVEAGGAVVTAGDADPLGGSKGPPPGSSGDGEKEKAGDQKEQPQTKPPRPITPRPVTPRGTNKAALRFNLPPEPLRSDPGVPPPAIPPRSPRVPLPPSNKDGPEQL